MLHPTRAPAWRLLQFALLVLLATLASARRDSNNIASGAITVAEEHGDVASVGQPLMELVYLSPALEDVNLVSASVAIDL